MIRLLGFQPLDAADQEEVAVIFTAGHALRPVGKAFDELISEMGTTAHAALRRGSQGAVERPGRPR